MKTRINNVFILCLLGLLLNFTFDIIKFISSNDSLTGIEMTSEQNDEENRDSEENEENRENTETKIDDFFGHNFDLVINLYSTRSDFSRYFNNYTFNKVHDLNTQPPEFTS